MHEFKMMFPAILVLCPDWESMSVQGATVAIFRSSEIEEAKRMAEVTGGAAVRAAVSVEGSAGYALERVA